MSGEGWRVRGRRGVITQLKAHYQCDMVTMVALVTVGALVTMVALVTVEALVTM